MPGAGLRADGLRTTAPGVSRGASSWGSCSHELGNLLSAGRSLSGRWIFAVWRMPGNGQPKRAVWGQKCLCFTLASFTHRWEGAGTVAAHHCLHTRACVCVHVCVCARVCLRFSWGEGDRTAPSGKAQCQQAWQVVKAPAVPRPPPPRDSWAGCSPFPAVAVRRVTMSHGGAGVVAVVTETFPSGISLSGGLWPVRAAPFPHVW